MDNKKYLFTETTPTFYNKKNETSNNSVSLSKTNDIDFRSVQSVLQFGAIVPPLSPWVDVARFLPGSTYQGTTFIETNSPNDYREQSEPLITVDSFQRKIEKIVDAHILSAMSESSAPPVVLFSGGVDSGFLASRLVALGFQDTLLINYSFGNEDRESDLAKSMAKELGLRYERVSKETTDNHDVLFRPGQIYSQPFGDVSVVPTSELALAVSNALGGDRRVIFDGTGADGAFGMTDKVHTWKNIYKFPELLRRAIATSYLIFWNTNGSFELYSRIIKRSSQMPISAAVVAQNALRGILYTDEHSSSLNLCLQKWVEDVAGRSHAHQIVAADLALTCANVFAQKALAPLAANGHKLIFPFLDQEIFEVALKYIDLNNSPENKAPLKNSLCRHVPKHMVWRPKSGFADTSNSIFYSTEVLEKFRRTTDENGPISTAIHKNNVTRICDLLSKKKPLSAQVFNFIWAATFTDRWFRTV